MRYFEIASGVQMIVNSAEAEMLALMKEKPVSKDSLDDRQKELARRMLSRGLLNHFKRNDIVFYRPSSVTDIWRDRDDA